MTIDSPNVEVSPSLKTDVSSPDLNMNRYSLVDSPLSPRKAGDRNFHLFRSDEVNQELSEFEDRVKELVQKGQADKQLVVDPKESLTVEKKEGKLLKRLTSDEGLLSTIEKPLFIDEVLKQFQRNECFLKRPQDEFTKAGETRFEALKRQRYEIDSHGKDEENNCQVKQVMDLLEPNLDRTRKILDEKLSRKLMKVYDMAIDMEENEWPGTAASEIGKRVTPNSQFFQEPNPILFQVRRFGSNLQNGNDSLEPLFLSIFLVDIKEKQRISAVFHCDLNTETTLSHLPFAEYGKDTVSKVRNCIFHVKEKTPDIYAVVVVTKILEGDEDTVAQRYVKNKVKLKEILRIQKMMPNICSRMYSYRQPIAWMGIPMFYQDHSLRYVGEPVLSDFRRTKGNMSMDDIYYLLNSESSMKKLKSVNLWMQVKMREIADFSLCKYRDEEQIFVPNEAIANPQLPVELPRSPSMKISKFDLINEATPATPVENDEFEKSKGKNQQIEENSATTEGDQINVSIEGKKAQGKTATGAATDQKEEIMPSPELTSERKPATDDEKQNSEKKLSKSEPATAEKNVISEDANNSQVSKEANGIDGSISEESLDAKEELHEASKERTGDESTLNATSACEETEPKAVIEENPASDSKLAESGLETSVKTDDPNLNAESTHDGDSDKDEDGDHSDDNDDEISDISTVSVGQIGGLKEFLKIQVPDNSEEEGGVVARNVKEFQIRPTLEFSSEYEHFLYVRPLSVNLNTKQLKTKASRNITAEIKLKSRDDSIIFPGDCSIVGRSSEPFLNCQAYTDVTYRDRNPNFNDEFRIKLPDIITPKHHLVVTFMHVRCRNKNAKKKDHIIGRTVIPLLDENGCLLSGTRHYQIISTFGCEKKVSKAEVGQQNLKNYLSDPNLPLLSHGRTIFSVSFVNASTVYTHEENINSFFKLLPYIHSPNIDDSEAKSIDDQLSTAILKLHGTAGTSKLYIIVRYLPLIFDNLLHVLCCNHLPKSQTDAFTTLIQLVYIISKQTDSNDSRNHLLWDYIHNLFQNFDTNVTLFSVIPKLWVDVIEKGSKSRSPQLIHSLQYAWVWFDLIIKSLGLYLVKNGIVFQYNNAEFSNDLEKLLVFLGREVPRYSEQPAMLSRDLNTTIALFLRDLLDLLDRGLVMKLMNFYLANLYTSKVDVSQNDLSRKRLEFLTILADYVHYIPLSLPRLFPKDLVNIPNALYGHYYLCGLVCRHLSKEITHHERDIRIGAIQLLRKILSKHEYDSRYQDQEIQNMIYTMYFPYVLTFVQSFDLFLQKVETKIQGHIKMIAATEDQLQGLEERMETEDKKNRKYTMEEIEKVKMSLDVAHLQHKEEKLKVVQEKELVYSCVIKILSSMNRDLLKHWFKNLDIPSLRVLFQIFSMTIDTFMYTGQSKIQKMQLTNSEDNMDTQRKIANQVHSMLVRNNQPGQLRAKIGTLRRNMFQKPKRRNTLTTDLLVKWKGLLSSEISMSILEILFDFVNLYKDVNIENGDLHADVALPKIYSLIDQLLASKERQSKNALKILLHVIHSFVVIFSVKMFDGENCMYIEKITQHLLRHCSSKFKDVRTQATSILYSLVKINYSLIGNISKTKMNITVALSILVKNGLTPHDVNSLQRSFTVIAGYARDDPKPPKISLIKKKTKDLGAIASPRRIKLLGLTETKKDLSFPEQVEELISRLHKTLKLTVRVNETRNDPTISPEAVSEFMLGIAHNYRHAPELHISWLNHLYDYHNEKKRYAEAAMVTILIAANSYHFLTLKRNPRIQSVSYDHLLNSSPTLRNVSFAELKKFFDEEEDPELSHEFFTEEGFISLIWRAITKLKEGQYYEYGINLYKLLVQYHEPQRNFEELKVVYADMSEYYGLLDKCWDQNRLFGSYYKFGFYGACEPELNGNEYLYKFPTLTRLEGVTEYIEEFFNKYPVKIKSESFQITDEVRTQTDRLYIIVTSLKPYHTTERLDYFAKNTEIEYFYFETPFTKSGKPRAGVTDQYMRQTIVQTQHLFPCLLNKSDIKEKQIKIIDPLHCSMNTINKTLTNLRAEVREPPNLNSLHLVLTGSVVPSVHEGVPSIVSAFLGPNAHELDEPPSAEDLKELHHLLRDFLMMNRQGIVLSGKYKSIKQTPLHAQFCGGFKRLWNLFKEHGVDVTGIEPEVS